MAVKTKAEIMSALSERLGESTDDATLEFIGDLQDTLTDFETRTADQTKWKEKYEQNDADWRRKYKQRFFSGDGGSQPEEEDDDDEPKPLRFEDLFTTK